MFGRNDQPVRPRNGHTANVLIVARISGCPGQKDVSLEDQGDHGKEIAQQAIDGPPNFTIIATRGKGERLDRPELREVEKLLRSRRFDLLVFEDIGRLVRGPAAHRLCGIAVDHGTRVLSPNDFIDTNDESWEDDVLDACKEHARHNAHTSRRLKKKLMSRFVRNGEATPPPIAGYIKPEGAKCYADWIKAPGAEEHILKGWKTLKATMNGSAVAEYFNSVGFPVGPFCRKKKWDGTMALRFYRNPLLKGMPERGNKHTVKHNESGRRKSVRNPRGPVQRHEPHLAYIDPADFDRFHAELTEHNAPFRRPRHNGCDPREHVPRQQTYPPGQHATCWYCGRHYVWGANGITGHLMCSGARELLCWNSIGIDGKFATRQLVQLILKIAAGIRGVEEQFQQVIRAVREENHGGTREEWAKLESDERRHRQEKENLLAAIRQCGEHKDLRAELDRFDRQELDLAARRTRLEQLSDHELVLPGSTISLAALLHGQLCNYDLHSFEMAVLLRQLVPQFHVYLVRLCDGGHLLPRAVVTLDLLGGFNDASLVPGLRELLQNRVTLDLFPLAPKRERIRSAAVQLSATLQQRQIAAALPESAKQVEVWKALELDRLMRRMGLSSPFLRVDEPPDDYPKLRRHKNPGYRFEMRQGYARPLR